MSMARRLAFFARVGSPRVWLRLRPFHAPAVGSAFAGMPPRHLEANVRRSSDSNFCDRCISSLFPLSCVCRSFELGSMIRILRTLSSDLIEKDCKCLYFLRRLAVLVLARVDSRSNVGGMGWY